MHSTVVFKQRTIILCKRIFFFFDGSIEAWFLFMVNCARLRCECTFKKIKLICILHIKYLQLICREEKKSARKTFVPC